MSILKKTDLKDNLAIKSTNDDGTYTISSYHDEWQYADTFNINAIQTLTTNQLTTITSISPLYTNSSVAGQLNNDYNTSSVKTTKYVIAGDRKQYAEFIKRKGFSETEYQYLYDADMIEGLRNVHGFYVGSWREREDINKIKQNIIKSNMEY